MLYYVPGYSYARAYAYFMFYIRFARNLPVLYRSIDRLMDICDPAKSYDKQIKRTNATITNARVDYRIRISSAAICSTKNN